MALVCRPEFLKFLDLCHYLSFKLIRVIKLVDYLLSNYLLLIIMIKDDGSVHWPNIIALSIQLCWIMNFKEMLNDLLGWQFFWIKCKLYNLCMTCIASFYLFVFWLLEMPPTKSALRFNYSLKHSKTAVYTPITSASNGYHIVLVLHSY